MDTQANTSATLNAAAFREQLCKKLALHLDPILELNRISSFLDSERIDLLAIEEVINNRRTHSVLSALAPLPFALVHDLLTRGSEAAPNLRALSKSVQVSLAETVAVAYAMIAIATRETSVGDLAPMIADFAYAIRVRPESRTTEIELRRGCEVANLCIYGNGTVALEHSKRINYLE